MEARRSYCAKIREVPRKLAGYLGKPTFSFLKRSERKNQFGSLKCDINVAIFDEF